ncbi:MAG: hypothetical protein NZM37_05235 [Sandaracinaceae bacterium]|nr:hypothetical protein [Sandaracinaceae bacterium]
MPESGNRAPGVDLDNKVTSTANTNAPNCTDRHQDYVNDRNEMGVDNQLVGTLLGLIRGVASNFDAEMEIRNRIASGDLLIGVHVKDINSFQSDDSVKVDVFLVDAASCNMSPCPPMGGMVQANQMWKRRMGTMAFASDVSGRIQGGALTAGPLNLPLSFSFMREGMMINIRLTIQNAKLVADISENGLMRGNLGGGVSIMEILQIAEMIMPGSSGIVEGPLRDNADLDPDPSNMGNCRAVSAGIGFSAVSGTLQ